MTTPEDVERAKRGAVGLSEEACDAAMEHPHGSWLVCQATGPHSIHWGTEPMGSTHRWTDEEGC